MPPQPAPPRLNIIAVLMVIHEFRLTLSILTSFDPFIAILTVSLMWLSRHHDRLGDKDDQPDHQLTPKRAKLVQLNQVAPACQASLLIYVIGGIFLSLEKFEPPWIILVIAGMLSGILARHPPDLPEEASHSRHEPSETTAVRPVPVFESPSEPGMAHHHKELARIRPH